MALDHVGMDVYVIFGDSRSNGSRDIRGADFRRTNEHDRSISHKAETRDLRSFGILFENESQEVFDLEGSRSIRNFSNRSTR